MYRAMAKAERIGEMRRLYALRAYSDKDLAEIFGVDPATIYRTRIEIESEYPLIRDDDGRYRLDRSRNISSVSLNLVESLSLYLAGRRLSQQTRVGQRPVASALEKLAEALRQPMTSRLIQAAERILQSEQDVARTDIFQTVAQAWSDQRKIRLSYRALRREQELEHVFAPYLLEPSPWNDGIYLIGHSDVVQKVITLRLDRIVRAKLLGTFDLPENFNEEELLRHAWGIWGSEGEPKLVRLRFAAGQAERRVQESIWHPLQRMTLEPDGSVLWEAPIAEWREMLPWVRGWGADVEVLAPKELRESLLHTVGKMSDLYQMPTSSAFPYHHLYAKTARADDRIHLLLYHLLDVGYVALQLWHNALSPGTRRWVADQLQVEQDAAGRFMAFIVALHDLGKAGPAFQRKYASATLQRHLVQAGFVLVHPEYTTDTQQAVPHGTVSTWALIPLLTELSDLPKQFARQLAVAVGGHHGMWPNLKHTERLDDSVCPRWDEARRDLFWEVRSVFQPLLVQMPTDKGSRNALLTLLSALTSVADWIGSREEDFPFVEEPLPTRHYAEHAARQARDALAHLGWTGVQPTSVLKSLTELFPKITKPNAIQDAALKGATELSLPALVILEAPTGIGKTETALTLADVWSRRGQTRGMYVAMPTQATSNQMFNRVVEFLQHAYPAEFVNVNLAHSQARLNANLLDLQLARIGENDADQVAAMSWFMEQSKRTLLAPFGVGTVDQALLSILQTKHFFVRLFGLHQKVVIFDEVHAYDTYMSTLLDRLLAWLRALGTSVIILSATLPDETRRRLVKAYAGQRLSAEGAGYPQLTVAAADTPPTTLVLPTARDLQVEIEWRDDDPTRLPMLLVNSLLAQIAEGGCAAIICNTVRRAQELYAALRNSALPPETDLILFHARFPPIWRKEIEDTVLYRFGKPDPDTPTCRPRRAIVIATQVIEQSLDLDFDIMVSELAPIDLLIQRAGRLHRHDRGPRPHPRRLTILRPPLGDNDLPQFGASGYVYAPYVLLQSYLTLQPRTHLNLPSDTRALIQAVYASTAPRHPDPVWQRALQQAYTTLQKEREDAKDKAEAVRVLPPDNDYLFDRSLHGLEEDDPTLHSSYQAHTRDIGPSVSLVALFETEQGDSLEPDGSLPVNLQRALTAEITALLDGYVLNVQHWAVVRHFVEQQPPATWRKSARLRHSRLVRLGPDGYFFRIDDKNAYTIRLNRKVGLQIIKEAS